VLSNTLNARSKILLFSLVILPFTSLRASFIGLGELVIIIFFLWGVIDGFGRIKLKQLKQFYVTKFWLIFVSLTLLGFFVNVLFLGFILTEFKTMMFDLVSYIFILISVFVIEKEIKVHNLNIYVFLKSFFYIMTLTLLVLYLVSIFTTDIFGFKLSSGGGFSPLVTNVHQISMVMMLLPLIGLFIMEKEKSLFFKVVILVLSIIALIMVFETNASKAILGVLCGILFYIAFFCFRNISYSSKSVIYLVLFMIISFVGYVNFDNLVWAFQVADTENARAIIYSRGIEIARNSFLFGYGPGPHVPFDGTLFDAHQTFLTILLQSGIFGLVLFALFYLNILLRNINNNILVAFFIAISIYVIGGDILRRLPMWFFIVFLYH